MTTSFDHGRHTARLRDASLGELFTRVARARANAVAISDGRRQLRYRELDLRSDAIAASLVAEGEDVGERVGLACSRGVDLVIGLLGILKAGKAYVPLDPLYPPERLQFMIGDAALSTVVTDSVRDGVFASLEQFSIDDPRQRIDALEHIPFVSPDDPAYVMYTSGSSGTPKGVTVTHRSVLAMLNGVRGALPFSARDTWTMFHSYCFDFSVLELWSAVQHGGRLAIFREEMIGDPEWTVAHLVNENVTVFSQVPSVFRHLSSEGTAFTTPVCVRTLLFGGEPLDLEAIAAWNSAVGVQSRVVNLYGITETTVVATYHVVREAELSRPETRMAIGLPFPHVRVALLGRDLMPVSDGEVGEIYVGGQCLAAGYLNRPDLTRSQFMELSLGGEDGRWYKSGDLARAASDGSLHYAGRADDQVKVRGFRIEPAEIETALAGVSGVHAVAVVAQEDVIGEPKLVAFYVSDESSENALRNHALRLLPSQMVPARFIRVRELPLSPAGKIDRRRLTATPLNLRSGESIAFETSA